MQIQSAKIHTVALEPIDHRRHPVLNARFPIDNVETIFAVQGVAEINLRSLRNSTITHR